LYKSDNPFINKYFIYTLLFLSLAFAPSGIYLLWHLTGWETMFFLDKTLHGIFPCLFSFTNISQGILGYYLVYKSARYGNHFLSVSLWSVNYCIMFGILGFGYKRFMYAGTLEEWRSGKTYPLVDFFDCEVFYTLLVMGLVIIPGLYYPLIKWPVEKKLEPAGEHYLKYFLTSTALATIIGSIGFLVYVSFIATTQEKLQMSHGFASFYAPLVGFLSAQVAFGTVTAMPLIILSLKGKSKRQ